MKHKSYTTETGERIEPDWDRLDAIAEELSENDRLEKAQVITKEDFAALFTPCAECETEFECSRLQECKKQNENRRNNQ